MDALQFFRLRYDNVHGPMTDRLRDLPDPQLRLRPYGLNPVAWLLWHLARCEDVGVNRFVLDRPQVFDAEGWAARLGVARRDIGTGMTDAEVDALSGAIDVGALRAYWDAVGRATLAGLEARRSDDLDAPVARADLRRVVAEEGVLGPHADWVEEAWAAWPNRGAYLAQLALAHHYGHFYDIAVVRGLLERGVAG